MRESEGLKLIGARFLLRRFIIKDFVVTYSKPEGACAVDDSNVISSEQFSSISAKLLLLSPTDVLQAAMIVPMEISLLMTTPNMSSALQVLRAKLFAMSNNRNVATRKDARGGGDENSKCDSQNCPRA